jgi:hypothetical protein
VGTLSNPESFIDEVTEEVRRDKLFRTFRKYGWIGVLLVVGVVGGSAYNEWRKSQEAARAQAFGDAVSQALDLTDKTARRTALAAVPSDGSQAAVLQLLLASDPEDDPKATLAALDAVIADATQPVLLRDLASLRRVTVAGAALPLADRRAALEALAIAGQPFRVLAQEQLAYLLIEDGKPDDAIAALSALVQDQEATGALRGRASQVIVALGGTPPEPSQTPQANG